MAILKGAGVDRFLRAPDAAVKAALIYGKDEGLVRERGRALVLAVADSADDPFRVTRLEDDRLEDDQALLADEALALSMTGGRRAVWVSGAGTGFQRAVEAYLAAPLGDTLIVAEAGDLAKTSRLRQFFEQSPHAVAIACYEDTAEALRGLALETARGRGLAFDDDALVLLVGLLGSDRAASRGEIEKLMLYCHGQARISAADVQAACGDAAATSLDEALDAALDGDAAAAMSRLDSLLAAGTSPASALTLMHMYVLRLTSLRFAVDSGKEREAAVRGARPPIHFQRAPRVARQLARWDRESLMEAASALSQAILRSRELPSALEAPLAERALLTLARKSQSLRRTG